MNENKENKEHKIYRGLTICLSLQERLNDCVYVIRELELGLQLQMININNPKDYTIIKILPFHLLTMLAHSVSAPIFALSFGIMSHV